MSPSHDLLALVGPTATGKSAIALRLARGLDAEILSVDSMTVYRGLDVGTAKPSVADREAVPHHLIDVADPAERFSVARFQALARDAIAGIRARGKRVLVVGGSGLYLRAAVDDLEFPPHDPAVRARLETHDIERLAAMLRDADPDALSFVDLRNHRRLARALEVIEITGRPFSSFRAAWDRFAPVPVAALNLDAGLLRARIEDRLRAQLEQGLLDEVRALLGQGFAETPTAARAIPYAQAIALIGGELDEEGFLREGSRANRRLARRQRSWFRADPRARWFDATEPDAALAAVAAYYEQHRAQGVVA